MKEKIRAVVIMLVFASVVIGVYYKMNNTTPANTEEVKIPQTTVEKLLAKDLEKEYPATVKTVMKLYSQYSKCFYDAEYTDKELEKLLEQYRILLDDELVANNPVEEHLKSLQQEIGTFSGEEQVIISYYWPSDSANAAATVSPDGTLDDDEQAEKAVTYYTKNGQQYASTVVAYTLKQGTSKVLESKEKFVLRQDADGKWKILGWGLVNN